MKKIFLMSSLLGMVACAHMKTEMQSNPLAKISGLKVFVSVSEDGKRSESSLAGIIRGEAYDWLNKRGYELVDQSDASETTN